MQTCKVNGCKGLGAIYHGKRYFLKGYCRNHYHTIRDELNKKKAIEFLGGKCTNCGSTEKLEFDHIKRDREDARHCISQMLGFGWGKLQIELDKCQLLCKPCHLVKTRVEQGLNEPKHGTASMYTNRSCRCDLCRKAWAINQRPYQKRYYYAKKAKYDTI